jgi:hypothetical protein
VITRELIKNITQVGEPENFRNHSPDHCGRKPGHHCQSRRRT